MFSFSTISTYEANVSFLTPHRRLNFSEVKFFTLKVGHLFSSSLTYLSLFYQTESKRDIILEMLLKAKINLEFPSYLYLN